MMVLKFDKSQRYCQFITKQTPSIIHTMWQAGHTQADDIIETLFCKWVLIENMTILMKAIERVCIMNIAEGGKFLLENLEVY